jgi:hypothetical protein
MEWWQYLLVIVASILAGMLVAALASYVVRRRYILSDYLAERWDVLSSYLGRPFVKKRERTFLYEGRSEHAARDLEYAAPDLEVASPDLEVAAPNPEVAAPDPEVAAPDLEVVAAPDPEVTAPDLEVAAPDLEVAAPDLEVAAPDLEVAAREPEVVAPHLERAAPDLAQELKNNLELATQTWTGELLPFQNEAWNALQAEVDEVDKLPENVRDELAQAYIDVRLANSIVRLSTQFNHRSHDLNENYAKLRTSIAERLNKTKALLEEPGE